MKSNSLYDVGDLSVSKLTSNKNRDPVDRIQAVDFCGDQHGSAETSIWKTAASRMLIQPPTTITGQL
jgi:hypothetical protein